VRGIRSFSESLSQIVDSLPPTKLSRVIDEALTLISRDYCDEPEVTDAVRSSRESGVPNPRLAQLTKQRAEQYDREYQKSEALGELDISQKKFRLMCLYNGLSSLSRATTLSLNLVDDVLYDLSFASKDSDDFGKSLEKMFISH
jgi:hypothetical protein